MFDVSAEETIALAEVEQLACVLQLKNQDGALGRPGISWDRLVFAKPG
jgi:hypothetical protein